MWRRHWLVLAGIWSLLLWKGMHMAAAGEGLKAGDRIVFLGDSITQAGAGPEGYVTLVAKKLAEKHADLKLEVIGAGISGNRVPDLERRLQKDVLDRQPSVVVIYIGINDVWHSKNGRGTPRDDFSAGLKRIIGQIQKANARVILCTASVIGEKHDGSNELDQMLDDYCSVSRTVAKETGVQLLDLRAAFLSHLKDNNKDNKENNVLTTDGVHLNAAGNQFVAQQMLAGLNSLKQRLLKHIVLFKFKDEVKPEQVQEVVDAFAALPKRIDQIVAFEHGTDVSVENLAAGFTHGFVVTFRDAQGRDEYLPHPAHKEFVELVKPRVDKVLVFDYWVE